MKRSVKENIDILFHEDCDFEDLNFLEQCIYLAYIEENNVGGEIIKAISYDDSKNTYNVIELTLSLEGGCNIKENVSKYTKEEFIKKFGLQQYKDLIENKSKLDFVKNKSNSNKYVPKKCLDPYIDKSEIEYFIYKSTGKKIPLYAMKKDHNGYCGDELELVLDESNFNSDIRYSFYNVLTKKFEYIDLIKSMYNFEFYLAFGTYKNFDELFNEMHGNIYVKCCFYGYEFSDEEIKKYDIDLSKINFKSFSQEKITTDDPFEKLKNTLNNNYGYTMERKYIKNTYNMVKQFLDKISSNTTVSELEEIHSKIPISYWDNDCEYYLHLSNAILTRCYLTPSKDFYTFLANMYQKHKERSEKPYNLVGIFHRIGREAVENILDNEPKVSKTMINSMRKLVNNPNLLNNVEIELGADKNNLYYYIRYTFPVLKQTCGYKILCNSYCETFLDYDSFLKRAKEVMKPADYNRMPKKCGGPVFDACSSKEMLPIELLGKEDEYIYKKTVNLHEKYITLSWLFNNKSNQILIKNEITIASWNGSPNRSFLYLYNLDSEIEKKLQSDPNLFANKMCKLIWEKEFDENIVIKDLTNNVSYLYDSIRETSSNQKMPDLSNSNFEIVQVVEHNYWLPEDKYDFKTIFDLLYFVNYDLSGYEIVGNNEDIETLKKLGVKF